MRQQGPWRAGLALGLALCDDDQRVGDIATPLALEVAVHSELAPDLEVEPASNGHCDVDRPTERHVGDVDVAGDTTDTDDPLDGAVLEAGDHVRVKCDVMKRNVAVFVQARDAPLNLESRNSNLERLVENS